MSDWKSDLANSFKKKGENKKSDEEKLKITKEEVVKFFLQIVIPAFRELKTELEKYGRDVRITNSSESSMIEVHYEGQMEIDYSIKVRIFPGRAIPYPETRFNEKSDMKTYRAEGTLRSGSQDYDISQITKDEIIQKFLTDYKQEIHLP